MRRTNAEIDLVLNDILEQVTRQLLGINTVRSNRSRTFLVLNRIRTLYRQLCGDVRSCIGAEVLNKYSRELSGFLAYFLHIDLIPYGSILLQYYTVIPIEDLGFLAGFIRLIGLRRLGGSPELQILACLQTEPNGIGQHRIHRIAEGTSKLLTICSNRTSQLLHVDIRARECQRCFYRSGIRTLVDQVNNDISDVIACIRYVDGIPLSGTSLLRMTGLPVEVDIGLTSLTFTYVFETAVEVHVSGNFGQQVDVLCTLHTIKHVLLVNYDLLFTRCQFIGCIGGTVSRNFECHLDGYFRGSSTYVTIGEFRLILSHRIHVSYLDTIVGLSSQRLDRVGYVEFLESLCVGDNRNNRTLYHLDLHLHRSLEVLNAEIEFIRIYAQDHALRDSVYDRLSCSEGVVTLGQTGRRTVKRLTGLQVHRFRTSVGDGYARIFRGVVNRVFDASQIHFPPSGITLGLGHLSVPLELLSVFTGLVEIRSLENLSTHEHFTIRGQREINLRLMQLNKHRCIRRINLVLVRGKGVMLRLRLTGHSSCHANFY